MPPRAGTRATPAVKDAVSTRTTRTTRATRTTTKAKAADSTADPDVTDITSQMKRALKVSDPEPQTSTSTTIKAQPRKGKEAADGLAATKAGTTKRAGPSATGTSATSSKAPARVRSDVKPVQSAAAAPNALARPVTSSTTTQSSQSAVPSATRPTVNATRPTAAARTAPSQAAPSRSTNVATSSRLNSAKTQPRTIPAANTPTGFMIEKGTATNPATVLPNAAPTKRPSIRPVVSLKGKEKEQIPHPVSADIHPWSVQGGPMPPNERAQSAMAAIKTSLATLALAMKAGYTYGMDKDDWTPDRVDEQMAVCDEALRVLRELDQDGHLGSKGIEVEKAAQAIIARAMSLGMPRRAFDQLATTRHSLLRQYKASASVLPSVPAPSQLLETQRIPDDWLSAFWLPLSSHGDLPDNVSHLCFQHLIGAWSCLISIEGYGYDLPAFAHLLPDPSSTPSGYLHPLRLAMTSPISTTSPALSFFTRRVSHIPLAAPHWPHIFLLIAHALILTATASTTLPSGSITKTPDMVWVTIYKWIVAFIDRGDVSADRPKVASRLIHGVLTWAEEVIAIRQEDEKDWFKGETWTDLLNIWIDLARKSRDTQALDHALCLSTTSLSLHTCRKVDRKDQTAPDDQVRIDSPDEAVDRATAIFAQLGNVESVTGHADSSTSSAIIAALQKVEWDAYGSCVAGLTNHEKGQDAFARAYRTTERARRPVAEILRKGRAADPELFDVSYKWMMDAARATGFAVKHTPLVRAVVSQIAMMLMTQTDSPSYDSLATCCITAITYPLYYRSNAAEAADLLEALRLGRQIASLGQTAQTRAECLKSLTEGTYNVAHGLYSHQRYELAIDVLQHGIELAELALADYRKLDPKPTSQAWTDWIIKGHARYDLLASCLLSSDRREDAIRMSTTSLTIHDPAVYTALASSDLTAKVETVFKHALRLDSTISRLATWLTNDLEPLPGGACQERVDSILSTLDEKREMSLEARTWVVERLLQRMLERACKQDALETAYLLGKRLLGMLSNDELVVRRLRTLAALTLLTSSHGVQQDEFESLIEQGQSCLKVLRSSNDANTALATEYQAVFLIVRALNAYQMDEQPGTDILTLSERATLELRSLLVPPTESKETVPQIKVVSATGSVRNPSKKVAASKSSRSVSTSIRPSQSATNAKSAVTKKRRSSGMPMAHFDDVARLSNLLQSLTSLLGLLGHALAKVNTLKVLRALLRHREDSINDYVSLSGELATQYSALGKYTRAAVVFTQALRTAGDSPKKVSPAVHAEVYLRLSAHRGSLGEIEPALAAYREAESLQALVDSPASPVFRQRVIDKCANTVRVSLAHKALASIRLAEDNASEAIRHLKVVVGLRSRVVNNVSLLAVARNSQSSGNGTESDALTAVASTAADPKGKDTNPFVVPDLPPDKTGANEPSQDELAAQKKVTHPLDNKYLHGIQWANAEHVIEAYLELATAYAQRGSAIDSQYYLRHAEAVAKTVKSPAMQARTATKWAHLDNRMKKLDKAQEKVVEATTSLGASDGPDAFDLQTARGQLLARQKLADQAAEILCAANNGIHDLDTVFAAADALLPSPRKVAARKASLSSSVARSAKEPLLPSTLAHVLQQQAWLLREAGQVAQSDELYRQLKALQSSSEMKAGELYLNGKIALEDAFAHFKTDLFMSSLTESTIAMPMGTPGGMVDHRQSARHRIQITLDQANEAYRSALSLVAGSGRVEDVRQACLSLALLRAFQTSLGHGDSNLTSFAADLLATSTSVTLHREQLEAIGSKFYDHQIDDTNWPKLDGTDTGPTTNSVNGEDSEDEPTSDHALKAHWNDVRARYLANDHLSPDKAAYDLASLPTNWAVLSISVTEDRNTMFISRHQNGHEPLVFCLPLDRQGKRDGDDDLFTFDTGIAALREIIEESDACSKAAKSMTTDEQKSQWWTTKRTLDKRLKELIENVEYCWLGAFKTIFNPRLALTAERLALFRTKIERVFNLALFGSAHETKKTGKVHLNDSLLECFATLSSNSREEEIEDFIYFILDIYQFHGVPVAIAELDLDQIGVDIVTVLTEMEVTSKPTQMWAQGPEHILLALDKNVQPFPWESIPCLRGRPISRIPSLPFLLDQVAMGNILQPGNTRRVVNSKKTYFILNPSGDLKTTQATFEPMLKEMQEHSGWKGIIGDRPSELELSRILRDYDLVLYFGHGGGEQYIRGAKVRTLPKCATTFLWGCSSGKLEDQGDLDAAGTAWNYMMAGCPSLTATLWDVTDRDIDRITTAVYNRLGLNSTQIMEQGKPRAENSAPGLLPPSGQGMGLSTVEAVNQSREDCKMTFLTGAAVVHYGIPVYIY